MSKPGYKEEEREHVLTPEQAIQYAVRSIEELRLAEQPHCGLLQSPDRQILGPMLASDEPEEDNPQHHPKYYIVPVGIKNERAESGVPLVRHSILIDAYTGEFEELTTFGKPVTYLDAGSALKVVAAALRVTPEELRTAEVTMMFQPGEITYLRAYPFWRVTVGERTYYVDQTGKMFDKLSPGVPGN